MLHHFQLLDKFGHLSLRRFVTFVIDLFSIRTRRRGLKQSQEQSPAMMRGALMRAARQYHHRELQCGAPLLMIQLNEYITLTFDFNFGDGNKEIQFGVIFEYDSGDSISNS